MTARRPRKRPAYLVSFGEWAGLGPWMYGAPDTALQNDRICASQARQAGRRDLRQNGGSRIQVQRTSVYGR
jgi:hypothetical protein